MNSEEPLRIGRSRKFEDFLGRLEIQNLNHALNREYSRF